MKTASEFFNEHYKGVLRSDTQSIELMKKFAEIHIKAFQDVLVHRNFEDLFDFVEDGEEEGSGYYALTLEKIKEIYPLSNIK